MKSLLKFTLIFLFPVSVFAQNEIGQDGSRIITTAVPFLTIAPDARAAGMGDIGVATTPDANSIHWNPAKMVFIDSDYGFSLSYTPWLRKLVNDMSISYLTGYTRLRKEEVIAFSMLYFDLGEMQFTNEQGSLLQVHNPREYSFDATYSRQLSRELSLGITLRFIHSNLSGNISLGNGTTQTKPGNTAAGDISAYYQKEVAISGRPYDIAFGANISNIGAKISYTNNDDADFIPTNLRLGGSIGTEIDMYNRISFGIDINKLMVPTPPVYEIVDTTDDNIPVRQIVDGKSPDRGLFSGMLGSFADAPGGFSEELKEVMISVGAEYWYADVFAVRAGYFYENEIKGNRKYFSLGLGLRYQNFGLDFAYLIPQQQNHPLAETLRFSLHLNFESDKYKESVAE